jgi:MFS transporter, DHA3 family, macrolide efflux protein
MEFPIGNFDWTLSSEVKKPMSDTELTAKNKSYLKNFFVLWAGQLASLLGSEVVSFVITWYITDYTKNVLYLSLMMLLTFVPRILLSPLAGALADRMNRKLLLMASDALQALTTLILIFLLLSGLSLNVVWLLIGFNTLRAVFQALQAPAYMSILPQMVPRDKYSNVNGLTQLFQSLIQLAAPFLGSVLFTSLGLGHSLWIDIITFAIAFALLLTVKIPPAPKGENLAVEPGSQGPPQEKEGFWASLKSGYLTITAIAGLFPIIIIMASSNFLLTPFNTLSTYLINVVHEGDSIDMAWVSGAFQAGMILGSIVVSVKKEWKHKTVAIIVSLLSLWVGTILYALAPKGNFLWLSIAGFIITFLLPIGATMAITMIQLSVPHEKMGRVTAFFSSFNSAAMLVGLLVSGPLAAWAGAVTLIVATGVVGIAANLGVFFFTKMRLVEENLREGGDDAKNEELEGQKAQEMTDFGGEFEG